MNDIAVSEKHLNEEKLRRNFNIYFLIVTKFKLHETNEVEETLRSHL